ncbi:MAG: NAD(P)H-dependent oxidoreductase subunit E [Anaerolineae bacterium]|nr:NAD(P)H-dependent oxidoreductase subunit E [Anaerolineae bacterium]
MLKEKYSERIEKIFAKYPDRRSAVMPLLYVAQEEYGWVTPEGVDEVAELCGIDRTQVDSIAGFYTMYRESPKGKYWLQVCTDLPCALRGAEKFYQDLIDYLKVEDGGTTADNLFTVEKVMCLAACDRAPMLQCNFHYHENLDMDKMKALIDQWRNESQDEDLSAQPRSAVPQDDTKADYTESYD